MSHLLSVFIAKKQAGGHIFRHHLQIHSKTSTMPRKHSKKTHGKHSQKPRERRSKSETSIVSATSKDDPYTLLHIPEIVLYIASSMSPYGALILSATNKWMRSLIIHSLTHCHLNADVIPPRCNGYTPHPRIFAMFYRGVWIPSSRQTRRNNCDNADGDMQFPATP
jgi:hypothetical protein